MFNTTAPHPLLIDNTPRGTRTLISGNLSPVHMPILLQGCSPPTRIERRDSFGILSPPLRGFGFAHSVIGNPSDFLSHLLRRFGSTIRCSAIKLRRTCGMRESNSHELCPAVFETAPSTFIGIPSESLSHPLRGFGFPAIPLNAPKGAGRPGDVRLAPTEAERRHSNS